MTKAKRILIVEDETHLAQGLLFNLQAEGYEAAIDETGEAVLERLHPDRLEAELGGEKHAVTVAIDHL